MMMRMPISIQSSKHDDADAEDDEDEDDDDDEGAMQGADGDRNAELSNAK
jgi:hypothetical protein